MKCGGIDYFEHLLECAAVGPVPLGEGEEVALPYLCRMVKEATEHAPVWPALVGRRMHDEISLVYLGAETDCISSPASMELSQGHFFDGKESDP